MDQQIPKNPNSVATQTDPTSNKRKGLDLLDLARYQAIFIAYDEYPTPLYRENLNRVFNEEFIAQVSKKDFSPVIEFVKNAEWENLKASNLSITALEETY